MCESDDSMIKFSLIRRGGLELHSIFSLLYFKNIKVREIYKVCYEKEVAEVSPG